jgi:hypothetical protein
MCRVQPTGAERLAEATVPARALRHRIPSSFPPVHRFRTCRSASPNLIRFESRHCSPCSHGTFGAFGAPPAGSPGSRSEGRVKHCQPRPRGAPRLAGDPHAGTSSRPLEVDARSRLGLPTLIAGYPKPSSPTSLTPLPPEPCHSLKRVRLEHFRRSRSGRARQFEPFRMSTSGLLAASVACARTVANPPCVSPPLRGIASPSAPPTNSQSSKSSPSIASCSNAHPRASPVAHTSRTARDSTRIKRRRVPRELASYLATLAVRASSKPRSDRAPPNRVREVQCWI